MTDEKRIKAARALLTLALTHLEKAEEILSANEGWSDETGAAINAVEANLEFLDELEDYREKESDQ